MTEVRFTTQAGINTLLARLTALRAGYLDELAAANIPADIDALTVALAVVDTLIEAIKATTDALGILEETGGTITSVLNTEVTVYRNNTPAGVFIPMVVKIATSSQTATETITVKEYYRIVSGGGLILHDWKTYIGLITAEEITVHLDPNRFGAEVTLLLDAGTPRDYAWEAIYEV